MYCRYDKIRNPFSRGKTESLIDDEPFTHLCRPIPKFDVKMEETTGHDSLAEKLADSLALG